MKQTVAESQQLKELVRHCQFNILVCWSIILTNFASEGCLYGMVGVHGWNR
jgi:hypothetical protein